LNSFLVGRPDSLAAFSIVALLGGWATMSISWCSTWWARSQASAFLQVEQLG
jgi:hypothetical protein